MNGRCPFCWSLRVSRVAPLGGGHAADTRLLMECRDCEKWFRAESGEEVPRLFELCTTPFLNPRRCEEEIREILSSGGNGFRRRRAAEFNRVCSDCLNARFVVEKMAVHA